MSITKKSILKWPGGKSQLLESIFAAVPAEVEVRRFIDVFAGSGVVGANARGFKQVHFNDINQDLVTLYLCLKQDPVRLLTAVKKLFTQKNCDEKRYYALRDRFNSRKGRADDFLRSSIFVYLNKHTFNGLCRYNKKGAFNAPFGWPKSRPKVDEAVFFAFAKRFKRATITVKSFQDVLAGAGAGDVVYCDPPYSPRRKKKAKSFTAYAPGAFGPDEHALLVELAKQAASRGATVLISNHATTETRRLYEGALMIEFLVRRSIGAKGSSRCKVRELIAVYGPTTLAPQEWRPALKAAS